MFTNNSGSQPGKSDNSPDNKNPNPNPVPQERKPDPVTKPSMELLDKWIKQAINFGNKANNAQTSISNTPPNPQRTPSNYPPKAPHNNSKPLNHQPKPAHNNSKPLNHQPKPAHNNSKPLNHQPKPAHNNSKPFHYSNKPHRPKPPRPPHHHGKPKPGFPKFKSPFSRAFAASPPSTRSIPTTAGQTIPIDPKGKLRVIPIGGLDEVGKNCMIFEYEDSIVMIDLGFEFPNSELLGIDYVIPDIDYLKDKLHKIKAIVVTHGHLDHIGGIPYILPKIGFPPIFACRLTMGLIEKQLEEFGLMQQANLRVITEDDILQFGKMRLSFYRTTHSIPDAVGVLIETPAGNVVHTGDFKIDLSPAGNQLPPDFYKIANFSQKNIVALFADSTNALKPGYTISETEIGKTLDKIIKETEGRIIIASFSSQIGRIQQIIDAAIKYKRKIYLSGRSLIDNTTMAAKLGYLKFPEGLIHDARRSSKAKPEHTIILTTGSQGEPVSALSRMSLNEHAHVKITKGDTVILSSHPIPGNETAVTKLINNLTKLGATIINNKIMDVHASGHAQQEDLKLFYTLIQPKYLVPIHGEYFMRKGHIDIISSSLGMPEKNGILIENGDILEVQNNEMRIIEEQARTNYIMVDGLGMGEYGSHVMSERQQLAENGLVLITLKINRQTKQLHSSIETTSRGFVYMQESKYIMTEIADQAKHAYTEFLKSRDFGLEEAQIHIKEYISKFIHQKLDREPLIITQIHEL